MMGSRGRGYVCVHIPKTGGTALALALEARAMADDLLVGDTRKALRRRKSLKGIKTRGRLWKHSTLSEAEGLIKAVDAELSDESVSFYPGVSYRHLMVWRGGKAGAVCIPPPDISGQPVQAYLP